MSTTDTINRSAAWDDDPRRNTGPRHAAPAYYTQPYQDVRYDRLPNPAAPPAAHRSIPGGPPDETPGAPMPAGPAYGGPEFQTDERRYEGPVAQPRGRSVRLDPAPVATRRGSMGRTVAIAVGAVLAAVGIVGGIVYGTTGTTGTDVPAPAPTTTSATTSGGHAIAPATGGGSGGHVTPPATPSAAVETLQKELGQLNYYEGPVTGFLNTQTTQAITYLQRDAHLPQTGTMNAATQAALTRMLATGNNHMGG